MKILTVAVLLLVVACGKSVETKSSTLAVMAPPLMVSDESVSESPDAVVSPDQPPPPQEYSGDLIKKTAHVRFQVDNVEKTTQHIEELASKRESVIADQNLTTATNEISNTMVVRVPVSSFEAMLDDLSKEALFVDYKRTSSQNVTEEYYDVSARLKTKKEARDRYTDILRTKAKTVKDILEAEEHIRALQEEIEAKEVRLRFLKTRSAMSEINLEIYQKVIFKETPTLVEKPYSAKVTQALTDGWSIISSGFLFMLNSWPILLIGIFISLWWRKFRRRFRTEEA